MHTIARLSWSIVFGYLQFLASWILKLVLLIGWVAVWFACYLLQCPAILWKNCFERPIQYIYGFANEPWQILPIMVLYAAAAMLIMGSIDKVLNPIWNRLVAFAAKYDEKWNTKQLW